METLMKQDRFLTGILIGIAVLIVLALAVFFTRKDNLVYVADDTPAGVVQNFVVALHKRDFEKGYSYLPDVEGKPTLEQFRQAFLNYSINPGNVGLEIGKTEINGNDATVELAIIYNNSDPFGGNNRNPDHAQLLKQGGIWKLRYMPSGYFWAWDWYQPTPQSTALPVK
jgi:hypothetical protein